MSNQSTTPATCLTSFETVYVYNWILFVVGLLGNTLSIIIMNRARMRSNTTSITITTLAVADTLTLLLKCLQTHLKHVQAVHSNCYLIEYFTHVCVLSSIWIIVWMTMERAVAVWWPLQISNWPTKVILIIIFTCTIVIFSLINIHFLIAYEAKPNQPWSCSLKASFNKNSYIKIYYYWIKSLFYSWIPLTLILTTNFMIVFAIFRASKARELLLNNSNPSNKYTGYVKKKRTIIGRNDRQLTIMLLLVSLIFVILTLPFSINQLYIRFKSKRTLETCFEKDFNRLVILLADLNHAINFILYCLCGQKFRKEVQRFLKEFCCCLFQGDNKEISVSGNRFNNNYNNKYGDGYEAIRMSDSIGENANKIYNLQRIKNSSFTSDKSEKTKISYMKSNPPSFTRDICEENNEAKTSYENGEAYHLKVLLNNKNERLYST